MDPKVDEGGIAGMAQPYERKRGVYCTIVAQNYLPQALALYSSIRSKEPGREFVILVIDGSRGDLAKSRQDLDVVGVEILGLTKRETLNLATIYDLVEFATAVKPLLLKYLLLDFEQAVYLDPDTYVISPLMELEALVDLHGVVLTPHLLQPIAPGKTFLSESVSLTIGVHNLGFCAVGREGIPFLDWWWSHLERECLIYPLLGLFVDQKWTDIGVTLFGAHSLQHPGYNIGHWNLHERQFEKRGSELVMKRTGQPVRLFHFSGFNPRDPDAISTRQNIDLRNRGIGSSELSNLSREYSRVLIEREKELGPPARYVFSTDLNGRGLSKRVRLTFRKDLLSDPGVFVPSPFIYSERRAFARWRITSYGRRMGGAAADAAIGLKYAFPDLYGSFSSLLPRSFRQIRTRLLQQSRIRR